MAAGPEVRPVVRFAGMRGCSTSARRWDDLDVAFLAAVLMIMSGLGVAALVLLAFALHHRETARTTTEVRAASRDEMAASIFFQIARAGGMRPEEAYRLLREQGVLAAVTQNADLVSWATAYARSSTSAQQAWLLDMAVKGAVAAAATIPLAQYNALLDLSFSLGFQTDALARLRARYRFEYVDYAKQARPRSAERGQGAMTMYVRRPAERAEMLRLLELEPPVTRQRVISAYRRLAALYHPDRFHNATGTEQQSAAEQFIRLTEVYEQLLALCDED